MVDNVLCYFLFRLQRIILATFAINNANLVCIMTEAGSCIIQGVKFLRSSFPSAFCCSLFVSRAKPTNS